MQGATLEELRELSRRSRSTQRWGFLALLAVLVLVPAQLVAQAWLSAQWAAFATVALGGLALVAYGYAAGRERGAFRRVFRRIADERRATRTLTPEEPVVSVHAR